jgi:hypothetical protein
MKEERDGKGQPAPHVLARVHYLPRAMRRALLTAVATAAVLAALVGAALWLWNLPPQATPVSLAASAATVPGDAEGLVVMATPKRLVRWLTRHTQAAGLVLLADPAGLAAARRLAPAARAMAAATLGPVRIWWRGAELAVGAEVDPGGRRALELLATGEGLAFDGSGSFASVATSPALLGGSSGRGPSILPKSPCAALARVGPRWWWVNVQRSRLTATTGAVPPLPVAVGPSRLTTTRLAELIAPIEAVAPLAPSRASIVVEAGTGWGLALPGARLSPTVRRLLGGDARIPAGPTPEHWHGLLGDLWVERTGALAVATSPRLLRALRGDDFGPESGRIRGRDAAYLLNRLARLAREVPGLDRTETDLSAAADRIETLRSAAWRVTDSGGIILLEW